MKYYKTKHLLFILPVIIIFGGFLILSQLNETDEIVGLEGPSIMINDTIIAVEIADEPAEQWQGLSDRDSLGMDKGMLFVFPDSQKRTFVMRRMHFSLDIIWIRDDEIVGISKNLLPEGEKPQELYNSLVPINYVLEVNGGFCEKNNIAVGDEVISNLQ